MSWDKSIGALSIKIRASVQFLAAGRDIRVPLSPSRTIVLHLRHALPLPLDSRTSFNPSKNQRAQPSEASARVIPTLSLHLLAGV